MSTLYRLPFYVKASLTVIGIYAFISMLSIAQDLILPVLYACITAILISPLVHFLERRKINRGLSIAGVLVLAILIIIALIALISSQASLLIDAWPRLADEFQKLINQVISWASGYFNISSGKINTWIEGWKSDLLGNASASIGNTLSTMGGVLSAAVLTPVYIFMLLYYQPHLIEFIHQLFGSDNDNNVREILNETKTIIKSYLIGLFLEFGILAGLNAIGLLILGIDYAILLGIIGALLNIIPYLGGLIAVVLYIIIALVTKSPEYVFYVIVLYTFIQLIDNNYIVPKIVGSKVKLNAFISIIGVIAGAALWGIPGMFLSIPLIAIIKLILDRIDSLKAWGFLLGDTLPPLIKWPPVLKRKK